MSAHRARRAALGVLAWLVIVALGSTLVWAVVSRAGAGVSEGPGNAPVLGAAAAPTPTARAPSARAPSGRAPSAPAGSSPSSIPSSAPSSAPSSGPSSAPPSARAPARVQGTWSGVGGALVVSCTGARIALDGAPANDGWAVEVQDRGPDRVRVELAERGEDERETRVEARCSDGRPVFGVRSDD